MRDINLDTRFDSNALDEITPKLQFIAKIPIDLVDNQPTSIEVNGKINLLNGELIFKADDSQFNIIVNIEDNKFVVDLENDIEYHPYIEGYKITPEVIHCVEDCELQLTADKL